MKIGLSVFLTCLILTFLSCTKNKDENVYENGIYKPYKQVVSPISAMTRDGIVDGTQIRVNFTDRTIGDIHFVNASPGTDPLREPTIAIDSIRLTPTGDAFIYPNYFDFPPKKVERNGDSLFLKPPSPGTVSKFSPHAPNNIVIVTDNNEAKLYNTQTGKFLEPDFVLFSYNIFVKRSFENIIGAYDANYIDVEYLKKQLYDGDTLVYVRKDTYFKKN